MKNKNLPLILGGVIVLAIIAFFLLNRGGTSPLSSSPEDLVANALTGTGSVKCEYTDGENRVVTAYLKDGNMRTDMMGGEDGSMSMIYKDKTSWTWDNVTKQGMMYTAPEVDEAVTEDTTQTEETVPQDSEEVKAELEQYKESCKNESIADSMFTPPADVTFQDFSQMMQQQMQNVPQEYQQYMPQE